MNDGDLPYFDACLASLPENEATLGKLFGLNVHWGYWDDPAASVGSPDDFLDASNALLERLLRFLPHDRSVEHLDVGCGFGGTLHWLDARRRDSRLVGLNIDPRQIARAKARVVPSADRGNRFEWVVGDACALPFPDESFDAISAVECIFHFPSRDRFFAEARRVLRPGGRLVLSDFVFVPWRAPLVLPKFVANGRSLAKVYGRSHLVTGLGYRRLARRHELVPLADEDVTKHTLPTYRYLDHYGALLAGSLVDFVPANRVLAAASRRGVVTYRLLAWEKPAV
jgi:SAM-dependent methyltransferase